MPLLKMIIDCQLETKHFHNKFIPQIYTKHIEMGANMLKGINIIIL